MPRTIDPVFEPSVLQAPDFFMNELNLDALQSPILEL